MELTNAIQEYKKTLKSFYLAESRNDRNEYVRLYHVLDGMKTILKSLGVTEEEFYTISEEVGNNVQLLTTK